MHRFPQNQKSWDAHGLLAFVVALTASRRKQEEEKLVV